MKMDMMDGLSAVLAAVVYNTVAVFKLFLLRNFCNRLKNVSYFRAVGGINLVRRADMLFGNYYNVERGFWVYVVKRVNILILIDLCTGNLPRCYFAEKTIRNFLTLLSGSARYPPPPREPL